MRSLLSRVGLSPTMIRCIFCQFYPSKQFDECRDSRARWDSGSTRRGQNILRKTILDRGRGGYLEFPYRLIRVNKSDLNRSHYCDRLDFLNMQRIQRGREYSCKFEAECMRSVIAHLNSPWYWRKKTFLSIKERLSENFLVFHLIKLIQSSWLAMNARVTMCILWLRNEIWFSFLDWGDCI